MVLGNLRVAFAPPLGLFEGMPGTLRGSLAAPLAAEPPGGLCTPFAPLKLYLVPSGVPGRASGSALLCFLVVFTCPPAVDPRGSPGGLRTPFETLMKAYVLGTLGPLTTSPARGPREALLWSSPVVGAGEPPLRQAQYLLGFFFFFFEKEFPISNGETGQKYVTIALFFY